MVSHEEEVATILKAAAEGDTDSAERLWPMVYDDLRGIAHARLQRAGRGGSLQTTELVHESWLRLVGEQNARWSERRYFFGTAARAMQNILVDHARKRGSLKREAARAKTLVDDFESDAQVDVDAVLTLSEAIDKLAQTHPRPAELVCLRFHTGLSMPEAAESLEISLATAERDWRFARAWLQSELGEEDDA